MAAMASPSEDKPAPYAEAAAAYIRAGWSGVLPLPLGKKWPPYNGYTGEKGAWPSGADVQAWLDGPEAGGNIALRLPTNVIGLDVDAYHGKQGHQTMADARDKYGDLPRTWRTTSRIDNHSGIYLFRIADETLRWPGQLGTHVEIIQQKHRYAVAPPSLHPEGLPYRWIDPHRNYSIACPRVDDLPYLPDAWVQGITAGQQATDTPRASMDAGTATPWLISRLGNQDASACGVTDYAGKQAIAEHDNGSRHDAIARGTLRLVRLAAEGHIGCFAALNYLRAHFVRSVTTDGSRDDRTAAEEWVRALVSACNVVAANPSDGAGTTDPCDLASLIVTVPTASTPESPAQPPSQPQSHQDENWEGLIPPTAEEAPTPSAGAQDPNQDQLLHAQINEADPRFTEALAKEMMRRQVRARVDEQEAERTFRRPPFYGDGVAELAIVDSPTRFAIEHLLPADGNAVLVAPRKTGKTTMMNALMKALTEGSPFLGYFKVAPHPGRVGIFNYEVSEAMYRTWLHEAGLNNPHGFAIWHLRGYSMPMLSRKVQGEMIRWLTDNNVETWILDPYARAYQGTVTQENDNSEVGQFLEIVDNIKSQAGVRQIIMPAHTGKGGEEGMETARGATRLEDWPDAIWTYTIDKQGHRFLRAIGRDVDVPSEEVKFDQATRSLKYGGWDQRGLRRRMLQNVIIGVVRNEPGINAKRLRDEVRATGAEGRNTEIDATVDSLVGSRELIRREVTDKFGRHVEHHLGNPRDGGVPNESDK